jgi:hypothetical protein
VAIRTRVQMAGRVSDLALSTWPSTASFAAAMLGTPNNTRFRRIERRPIVGW